MDLCSVYFLAAALVITGDIAFLFFAPRLLKARRQDPLASGGAVSNQMDPATILRFAAGLSILFIIVLFAYLLNQEGCLS